MLFPYKSSPALSSTVFEPQIGGLISEGSHGRKKGINLNIPGFWEKRNRIKAVFSDYTGTLSLEGKLIEGVKERLRKLAKEVDIYVVTSDTRGTAKRELRAVLGREHLIIKKPHDLKPHDIQKLEYLSKIIKQKKLKKQEVAVFGNGRNDRKWLKAITRAKGLAIAVDVGEGCAIEAMSSATIFVSGINNGLDLLLDPKRSIATLRTLGDKPPTK